VYRGLDVGTAKASTEDRAGIPHHGLDLVDPDVSFTLADFTTYALDTLAGIADRGALAILVGGTGLYLRAVARGIDTTALPSDSAIRASLEADLATEGLEPLVTRLRAAAPGRAARTDLRNPRRVVRALEIVELEGDRETPPPRGYSGPAGWIGLRLEHATHREWIAARARAQFEAGLIEEARALRDRFDPTLPAFSAIGYREAWAVLDGTMTTEEAIVEDARRNVGFAKRQRTWFRSEPGIEWLEAGDEPRARAAALRRTEELLGQAAV
jgi:tRNA dimethylallyltransferase